jgi:hypothetical protein
MFLFVFFFFFLLLKRKEAGKAYLQMLNGLPLFLKKICHVKQHIYSFPFLDDRTYH